MKFIFVVLVTAFSISVMADPCQRAFQGTGKTKGGAAVCSMAQIVSKRIALIKCLEAGYKQCTVVSASETKHHSGGWGRPSCEYSAVAQPTNPTEVCRPDLTFGRSGKTDGFYGEGQAIPLVEGLARNACYASGNRNCVVLYAAVVGWHGTDYRATAVARAIK